MPNKLSQFWQELKRRNVVRVITVYAGAAFVIIELINNITEPLRLPDWTPTLVIVLLAIGFPIVLIFSWIFDVKPEGGIVKTEPVDKVSTEEIPKSSNGWKIASYISFVAIVGLIVLNIIPRSGKKEILEKSIAVLPFINYSPEEEKMYFINGSMESILDNLSRIKDLRVVSRTSVEQYRNNPKAIPVIAEEMNVSYILEGSGYRDGKNIRLIVQLLDGRKDQHLWSKTYDATIDEIFFIQNAIAKAVAEEIKAAISPEEQELIEKIPTSNTTAFDLYQKANEIDLNKIQRGVEVYAEESINLLYYALAYDSTFVLPYVSLGLKYLDLYTYNPDLYSSYLDSVVRMTERALHFNSQSAEAYSLQGHLFSVQGKQEDALLAFDRALQLNPNLADAFNGKGWIYFGELDFVNALDNFYQNILRNRTPSNLANINDNIGFMMANVGLSEQAIHFYNKALHYNTDSIWYFIRLAQLEFYTGNHLPYIDLGRNEYAQVLMSDIAKDPRLIYGLAVLGEACMYAGQNQESYKYFKRYVDLGESVGWQFPWHKTDIAFIFRENGDEDKANAFIDQQIKQSENWIAERHTLNNDHYQKLAEAYCLKQDNENALRYLKLLSQQEKMSAPQTLIPDNPIFRGMKDDMEFILICEQIQVKYRAEQDKVRQWLEENDML